MNKNIVILLLGAVFLVGCSTHSVGPISAGKNSYVISKQLASFSNDHQDLLTSVFAQAHDVCGKKKRILKIEQLNEYTDFWGNENKATLIFSCIKQVSTTKTKAKKPSKSSKTAKTTKPVVQQKFPKKSKLTHYAM